MALDYQDSGASQPTRFGSDTLNHPYKQFEAGTLWNVVDCAIADLIANGDLELRTLPPYVIGYICERLSATRFSVLDHARSEEEEETSFYWHSASLRIAGQNLDFDEIAQSLGVEPTHVHRKGERRGPKSPEYKQDMW